MSKTFQEHLIERPSERNKAEEIKREMIAKVRGYRLRDLRETDGMTQLDLTRSLHMSLDTTGRVEYGDIEHTHVDTLRRYVERFGGTLKVEVRLGDTSFTIA